MIPASHTLPTRAFWAKYRNCVVVQSDGLLRLTNPGRMTFGRAFVAAGLSLDTPVPVKTFRKIVTDVAKMAVPFSVGPLEDELGRIPMSRAEEELYAQLTGQPIRQVTTPAASGQVVDIRKWRTGRAA